MPAPAPLLPFSSPPSPRPFPVLPHAGAAPRSSGRRLLVPPCGAATHVSNDAAFRIWIRRRRGRPPALPTSPTAHPEAPMPPPLPSSTVPHPGSGSDGATICGPLLLPTTPPPHRQCDAHLHISDGAAPCQPLLLRASPRFLAPKPQLRLHGRHRRRPPQVCCRSWTWTRRPTPAMSPERRRRVVNLMRCSTLPLSFQLLDAPVNGVVAAVPNQKLVEEHLGTHQLQDYKELPCTMAYTRLIYIWSLWRLGGVLSILEP